MHVHSPREKQSSIWNTNSSSSVGLQC
jgi:hypothetical protein